MDGGIPQKNGRYTAWSTEKLLQLLLIIWFKTHKCLKFSLLLTLLTALLLTYFPFGGWRYTLSVLTNQNLCYMLKLNDLPTSRKYNNSDNFSHVTKIISFDFLMCKETNTSMDTQVSAPKMAQ